MGMTETLRRIWLFVNKIKSSESFSKQPTQLIQTVMLYVKIIQKEFMHKYEFFRS